MAIFVRDITDRKQREEETLRQNLDEVASEFIAMEKLHDASRRLWRSPNLQSGIADMLYAVIQSLDADMGIVQLVNQEQNVLELVAHRGCEGDSLEFFRQVSMEEHSACVRSLRERRRIVISDREADAAYEPHRRVAAEAGYRAVQFSPLLNRDGKPLGILATHFRHPHESSNQELKRLDLFVRQAADFIEIKRSEETLRKRLANDTTLLRQAEQEALLSHHSGIQAGIV